MNHDLAFRIVTLLGQWTVLSLGILFAAWLATLPLRKHAAARHLVWVVAFVALLAVPIFTAVVPARNVIYTQPAVATVDEPVTHPSPISDELAGSLDLAAVEDTPPPAAKPEPPFAAIASIWLAGAALVALQALIASVGIALIRRRSFAWVGDLFDPAELALRLGVRRTWELRQSGTARPPAAMTWGFVRPTVLLPRDSIEWPAARLRATMLHELAHIRRADSLTQRLAMLACGLHWFNPAVWLAARALRADAEIAADDTVLRSGLKPSDYAAELLRIAAELGNLRQPAFTSGVSIMNHKRIENRIRAIVDPAQTRRGITTMHTLVAATLGLGAVTLMASFVPSVAVAAPGQDVVASAMLSKTQPVHVAQAKATFKKDSDQLAVMRKRIAELEAQLRATKAELQAAHKAQGKDRWSDSKRVKDIYLQRSALEDAQRAIVNRQLALAKEERIRASVDQARMKIELDRHAQENLAKQAAEMARVSDDRRAEMDKVRADIEAARAQLKSADSQAERDLLIARIREKESEDKLTQEKAEKIRARIVLDQNSELAAKRQAEAEMAAAIAQQKGARDLQSKELARQEVILEYQRRQATQEKQVAEKVRQVIEQERKKALFKQDAAVQKMIREQVRREMALERQQMAKDRARIQQLKAEKAKQKAEAERAKALKAAKDKKTKG